jgi:hypothetical protein
MTFFDDASERLMVDVKRLEAKQGILSSAQGFFRLCKVPGCIDEVEEEADFNVDFFSVMHFAQS